jgi:hypothetical protein
MFMFMGDSANTFRVVTLIAATPACQSKLTIDAIGAKRYARQAQLKVSVRFGIKPCRRGRSPTSTGSFALMTALSRACD